MPKPAFKKKFYKKPFYTQDPRLFEGHDLPFFRGLDHDSVFIETTHIQDKEKFKTYLNSFNTEDTEIYYGRQEEERTWGSRTFLETSWDTNTTVYAKLISEGLLMNGENVPLKGYKRLPPDVHVVRVRIQDLPKTGSKKVLEQLERRMSCFGQVLHLGLFKDGECFVGKGYAFLNMDVKAQEPLRHIVNWIDDRNRILLDWDHVPPICYFCKKEHYIRTECPAYMNVKTCFKCGKPGHVLKRCPYQHRPLPRANWEMPSDDENDDDDSDVRSLGKQRKGSIQEGAMTPNSEVSLISHEGIALFLEKLKTIPSAEFERKRVMQSQHLKSLLGFQERNDSNEENFIHL